MRHGMVRMAAVFAVSFAGPALAGAPDGFQENEQPGSEIELDIGGGNATIERKSGAPVFRPGDVPPASGSPQLDLPNDPDTPAESDPVDAELPGEGPEDLSGPDDDDPLPE
jgi:hypothetical protein